MTLLNYATQYSKALAKAYPYQLYFGKLWDTENKQKYKVIDAKTIKIPKITIKGGRKDGDRDTIGGFTRNFSNEWETKELKRHRTWETLVHPMDVNQTNQVATIANITDAFNQDEKFPEMDAITITELYAQKNALETIEREVQPNSEAVLTAFDEMMDAMDEERVPAGGRLLYCDTFTKTLIDNAIKISRANGDTNVSRMVSRLDEVEIISVPTKCMKSKYDFTTGFEANSGAKDVAMMLVHRSCIIPCVNYEFVGLSAPTAQSQGKYLYFEESFEDIFILEGRHHALQFAIKPAAMLSAKKTKAKAKPAEESAE